MNTKTTTTHTPSVTTAVIDATITSGQVDFKSSFPNIVEFTFYELLAKMPITAYDVTKKLRKTFSKEVITHTNVRDIIEKLYKNNPTSISRCKVLIDPNTMAKAFLYSKKINSITTPITTTIIPINNRVLTITTFTDNKTTPTVPVTPIPVQPSTRAVQGWNSSTGTNTHLVDSAGRTLIHKRYLKQLGWDEGGVVSYSSEVVYTGILYIIEKKPVSNVRTKTLTVRIRQNLRFKAPVGTRSFKVTVLPECLCILFPKNVG